MKEEKVRRCPRCRRETIWNNNPWKPFCSERCQMIDLGHWASEDYRVPSEETFSDITGSKGEIDREFDNDEQA